MFGRLVREAQSSLDAALSQFILRVIAAIPFAVAAIFATVVGRRWLADHYGADVADGSLALGFLAIGLIATIAVRMGSPATRQPASDTKPAEEVNQHSAPVNNDASPVSATEKELFLAALTTAAPVALPLIVRNLLKNLPLVMVLAGAAFVATRTPNEDAAVDPGLQPAE